MCGRYALILRPSQVRRYLEDEDMPVYQAPDDEGDHAPRQSYNFAPGYHGIVYRADTPDWGAGLRHHKKVDGQLEEQPVEDEIDAGAEPKEVRYKLQSMKWGLVPFWTKRNPDYGSLMKTINCRDDSLIDNKGMWTSMKQKKRCIVVAQGFYEWLKKGKDKVPHYVKRKDGLLMCWAGLWDCVQYEDSDEKLYTYTIITTDSNKQLKFLHDRMPVILENGSEDIRTWLDPKRTTWTKELQSLLVPFKGELEVYPVSKEVGKVGNNSPNFIIPVSSVENKSNIANFFSKGTVKGSPKSLSTDIKNEIPKSETNRNESKYEYPEKGEQSTQIKHEEEEECTKIDNYDARNNLPPAPEKKSKLGIKRPLDDDVQDGEESRKLPRVSGGPAKILSPSKPSRKAKSALSNNTASPSKSSGKGNGSQKITNFFSK